MRKARTSKSEAGRNLAGAMQKLRNLDVPDSRIDEVRKTMTNPRTIDWASPATGDIVEKKVIEGQRVAAGDELFRIADHARVWVVAEVAEADIGEIKVGMRATVTLQGLRHRAARRRRVLHLSGDDEARDAHGLRAHRAA